MSDSEKQTYTMAEVAELLTKVKAAVDRSWDGPAGRRFRDEIARQMDTLGPEELSLRLRVATERMRQRLAERAAKGNKNA